MASVNKASLREEFDTLKGQFERLCAEGKMGQDSLALFQALLMLFELLMAVFMEKRTTKHNRNSSLPSSQTPKDDDTALRSGTRGKGKDEQAALAANTRTRETVTLAGVEHCEVCGEDLSEAPCQGHERRTKIDIVFEKVVEHVDAQIKQCPVCHSTQKGQFPADLHGPLQYGDGLKAFVINLLVGQMVALKRVQSCRSGMLFMPDVNPKPGAYTNAGHENRAPPTWLPVFPGCGRSLAYGSGVRPAAHAAMA